MENYTTIFGEFVTFKVTPMHVSNYKFVVEKRVDGQLRTSYPVKSLGEAKRILKLNIA